jgi:hypothetical protein
MNMESLSGFANFAGMVELLNEGHNNGMNCLIGCHRPRRWITGGSFAPFSSYDPAWQRQSQISRIAI